MSERKRDGNAPEDWHKSLEKITSEREQYQYMLDHDIFTDCTFLVGPEGGETIEFRAHRLHIARMSPVFAAMFMQSGMVEAKTGHVRVTDLTPNIFYLLLGYIYGKEPQLTNFQEAQDLAFAAHKYQMNVLLETCVNHMRALIRPAHIWAALETADLLQQARLKETCLQVLQLDTLPCILHTRILQASEEHLALLLGQDKLNVKDELILVSVVVHWARQEAQRRGLKGDDEGVRAVLKPRLLSLFRFLTMSLEQYLLGPGLADWLSCDEKAAVAKCLERSKNCSNNKLPQHLSSVTQKRQNVARAFQLVKKSPKEYICRRKIIGTRPNVQQTELGCCEYNVGNSAVNVSYHCVHAKFIFKVSSSCEWLGFQCASRCSAGTALGLTTFEAENPVYQERIVATAFAFYGTISTDFQKRKIAETSYSCQNKYNSSIIIKFEKAMTLKPGDWFALDVAYQHLGSNYNINSDVPPGEYPNPYLSPNVHTAGVDFTFHTEEQAGYYASVNDGLIESLIFSL